MTNDEVGSIFQPFQETAPAAEAPAPKKTRKRRVAKEPALAAPYNHKGQIAQPNPPITASPEVDAAMHGQAPAAKRARKPRVAKPKVALESPVIMLDGVMLMKVVHGMDEPTSTALLQLLGALQTFTPKQRKQLAAALWRMFPS